MLLTPLPPIPGINASPTNGLTKSEDGESAEFAVVSNTQPSHDVTIAIRSSNANESSVDQGELLFTPSNWDSPQTFTVTGADDGVEDGDVSYQIVTLATFGADTDYDGLKAADVSIVNQGNDSLPRGGKNK